MNPQDMLISGLVYLMLGLVLGWLSLVLFHRAQRMLTQQRIRREGLVFIKPYTPSNVVPENHALDEKG